MSDEQTSPGLKQVEEIKSELTAFCYRMMGSIDEADEAVQETYIRVWLHWNSFRKEASSKTWIYRIAANIFWVKK